MGMGICVFSGFSFMQCCALQVLHSARREHCKLSFETMTLDKMGHKGVQ